MDQSPIERLSLGETPQLQNMRPTPATADAKVEPANQQACLPEASQMTTPPSQWELLQQQVSPWQSQTWAGPSSYGNMEEGQSSQPSQQASAPRCRECYGVIVNTPFVGGYCSQDCRTRAVATQLRQHIVVPVDPYFSAPSLAGPSSQIDNFGFYLGDGLPGLPIDLTYHDYDDDDDPADPAFAWPIQESGRDDAQELLKFLESLPDIDVPPDGRQRKPKALKCPLMPHQEIGLTWLMEQEESARKGGILADAMGLGKTVQALALILARPPKDSVNKTTLIVAPVALLRQWQREIENKVKDRHKLKTIIVHGPLKKKLTVSELQTYDVVLTSYGTILAEWNPRKKQNPNTLLLRPRYHRIILDEAHLIKNHRSQTARAISSMRATYRLCMTGTPLMNNLSEIYSLIHFLKIGPYDSWTSFNRDFIKQISGRSPSLRQNAMRALQAFLRGILLQRTTASKIDGKQIFQLPELKSEVAAAEFDNDQREFYLALENRMRLRFNKFVRAGTVGKHYSYILVLILRLRQCCCHPHLIKDYGIPDAIELSPDEMVALASRLEPHIVRRIRNQPEDVLCPVCEDMTSSPIIIYPCGHHVCGDCFTGMMQIRDMEALVLRGAESQPACPTPGCDQEVGSKTVCCYPYFIEAHASESSECDSDRKDSDVLRASDDADESADLKDVIASDDDEKADDVDDHGDLKDFIVPDSDQETGENGEEKVHQDRKIKPPQSDDDTGSDSDDSLPSLNEVLHSAASHKAKDRAVSSLSAPKRRAAPVKREPATRSPIRVKTEDDVSRGGYPDRGKRAVRVTDPLVKEEDGDVKPRSSHKRQRISRSQSADLPGLKIKDDSNVTDSEDDVKEEEEDRKGKRKRPLIKQEQRARTSLGRVLIPGGPDRSAPRELTFAELRQASRRNKAAKQKYLRRLRREWQPSAKTDKTMQLLQTIRDRNPREKTLIFSVFTSFLDLLEIPVYDAGYTYRRFDGSMSNPERDEAVEDFMTKPEVTVMLVGLKAGNAGLNLQAATQIIIVEPFWNPSVEDQAVGRAHRLGQLKPVTVHRLLIGETVEDRILALQDQKRKLVSEVLSNEAAKGLSRLTVNELASLFGINRDRQQRPGQ